MTTTAESPAKSSAGTEMPRIISVDDHVVEPPDLWSSRLPAKYRDVGPRIEYLPQGEVVLDGGTYRERPGTEGRNVAWWLYEDHTYAIKRLIAAAGYPYDEVSTDGITYDEMRPGCWQPQARVVDMDVNHTDASLCFPNYPRFCGQLFNERQDKELSLLCVKAYNDWMVEEWCGDSGGRLIPLCLIPLWDAELAAAEIYRNAERGVRAVAFSELPTWLGLPSIHSGYWDPFFDACAETGAVVCMHIGSGTRTVSPADDAPDAVTASLIFCNSAASLVDFLYSGVLHRYPDLKLMYAEAQIGWIPYALERADDVWVTHAGWSGAKNNIPEPPSFYYYRQVYGCFFKDSVGMDLLDRVGIDNITFETDYPHTDGTWPNTEEVATRLFGHLDAESVYKIARGNAIKLLGLDFD